MSERHEKEVERLLVKIMLELKEMNARQRKLAGEPEPTVRKSEGGVTSVTRGPGHLTVNETGQLPTALTLEQQEAMRAQRPGYKEVARSERFKPADEPAITVPASIARNFGRRDVLTTRDLR